ncbi:hypothetical protein GCM10011609_76300 [Lentzea pudingi]|uniref:DNA-binding domain-containing protein n=1 Tax=Lentzea pudingi TaxID=1789439 RepID=A0ABQ2ISJ5_9PSEU|nr:hypothetical protein GCM10011609_76300 [Lentzea pudingi]
MGHANARLTVHRRLVRVSRVAGGRPVAHVVKEPGVSRQCAYRWVGRFRDEGLAGLADRSSGPHRTPSRTLAETELRVVAARGDMRCGSARISARTGLPPAPCRGCRHGVPRLHGCDPLTGQRIRATRHTTRRYEHPHPGDLPHLDVKKIGTIPPGGGWRATTPGSPTPRSSPTNAAPPAPGSCSTSPGSPTRASGAFTVS